MTGENKSMVASSNSTVLGSQTYARKIQALIRLITELRALGAQSDIDLPRIAVIGNQSAGKSSLVEAISGITVPRASGTCTRCPMECRLAYSPAPFKCQVLLRIEKDEYGNPVEKVKETKFGPVLHDKSKLEDMLRRAQLAILNPSVHPDVFIDLDLETIEPGVPPCGSRRQLQFSSNVVCVDLSSPESANLAFIDLPGIISNVGDGEDPKNIELIKDLVREHITGNALILLTITMRDDIQNQSAALFAKAADPQGSRTIGVLTKPDTLQEGEHSAWLEVLAGRSNPLTHGYYVTKQPAVSELQEKLSYEEGRARENAFFERFSPWKEQDGKIRARMGVPNLTKQLSKLLSQLIEKTLPKLRHDSRHSLSLTMKDLELLPPPPPENPAAELLKLVTDFTSELKAHVTGFRGQEALIQACRRAFLDFKDDIFTTRPIFVPHMRHEDVDIRDLMKDEERFESKAPPAGSTRYLDDVRELIELSLTRELPHNVPFSVKVRLIEECFQPWPVHSIVCFDKVHASYQECLLELVSIHFEKYLNGGLHDHVRNIVETELAHVKDELRSRISWLLRLEDPPFTSNNHYFTKLRDKNLTLYKNRREENWASGDQELVRDVLAGLSRLGFEAIKSEDLPKLNGPDPYEQELIIMAEVSAYFRVAYKRIIDNLPRIIDSDFLRALSDRLQSCLIRGLRLDEADSKDAARVYLSEDADITIRRLYLTQTRDRLEGIIGKLSNFASLAK